MCHERCRIVCGVIRSWQVRMVGDRHVSRILYVIVLGVTTYAVGE